MLTDFLPPGPGPSLHNQLSAANPKPSAPGIHTHDQLYSITMLSANLSPLGPNAPSGNQPCRHSHQYSDLDRSRDCHRRPRTRHHHHHHHMPRRIRTKSQWRRPPLWPMATDTPRTGTQASGRQQQTVTAHKDKDTRVKLTNHALEVSMAAAAAINDDEARTTLRLSVEAVEEQRAVRKYAEQVLGLTLGGNNDNGNGLNEEPEVGVAMAAELADESSAGRMWDQSGASAYETDYGRDFD
ncbi:hypothetical protein BCR44DRAFT_1445881 [Catenaria anguillulae PL171]|uniref:Uncharacterized protein n=1 Tax=Catenaria anguillulae PL171 TaxID=765915 RepID=A0A1Y2H871_9FUNG|nr:hypothetical protein BCR44DRAFT_1445881 [Catenaria anguillulae PL171]